MRRNNLDIYADILKVANQGAKKTQIVYKANLNFNILKTHMNALMQRGFIEKNAKHYFTTERGKDFVDSYQTVKNLTNEP